MPRRRGTWRENANCRSHPLLLYISCGSPALKNQKTTSAPASCKLFAGQLRRLSFGRIGREIDSEVSRPTAAYLREWRRKNRAESREYIRNYMRRRRGIDYQIDLELEADDRGMTAKALARLLVEVIVRDDLFRAVLGEDKP